MDYNVEATETEAPALPAGCLPVTVLLRLDKRSRRDTKSQYFEIQVAAPEAADLDDFKPYVLQKEYAGIGGSLMVKRTSLRVEQYDPQQRQLLLSYSLPESKASDFEFELKYGHGFKDSPR